MFPRHDDPTAFQTTIRLDTETLIVSDNRDHDQYKNVGGLIGFAFGGFNTVGLSYPERTSAAKPAPPLDAADELNVIIHDATATACTTRRRTTKRPVQIAAIRKDAGNWWKDASTIAKIFVSRPRVA